MTISKYPYGYFFFFALCLTLEWACSLEVIPPESDPTVTVSKLPKALFDITRSSDFAPSSVTLTNNSINAKTYTWDFGDGTTSADPSPIKVYPVAGSYNVRLIARDSANRADTLIKPLTIRQRVFDIDQTNFGPAKKVIVLPTGEFVVAGTNYMGTKSVAYIFKTDTAGKIIPSFTKTFSMSDNTEVYDLIVLADGSFGICGSTISINKTNTDAFFARVRANGTTDTTRFGDPLRDGVVQSMVETTDGYIVFCGYENSAATKNDLWLSKRNPNAIFTDFKINKTFAAAQNEQGNKVILSANGDLMLFCTSIPSTGPAQSFFFRTDALGNQLSGYPKTIGQATDYNYGRNMAVISSNRLLLSGAIYPNGGTKKGWLTLSDANGVSVSSFSPNFGTDAELNDAQEFTMGSTNGFVGVGSKSNGAWFLKTSALGITQVDTSYGTVGTNIFYAVRPTSDGGFIMVGEKSRVARMLKTDANGKTQ